MNLRPSMLRVAVGFSLVLPVPGVMSAADNPPAATTVAVGGPTAEMILPLLEGQTDPKSLQALTDWIARRIAEGTGKLADLEVEVRRAVEKVAAEHEAELREGLDLVARLRAEREALRKDAGDARAKGQQAVKAVASRYAKTDPVPRKTVVIPHVLEASGRAHAAAAASDTDEAAATRTATDGPMRVTAAPPAPAKSVAAIDLDVDGLIQRIVQELRELESLYQAAEMELQAFLQRQQQTLQTISNVLKARHDAAMNAIRNLKG